MFVGKIFVECDGVIRFITVFQTLTSDMTHSTLDSDSRAGSACTSISNQSNAEDTIQWKKGNVLGKGAFGVVSVPQIMYKLKSNCMK